jgi:uncharacterized protein YjdB
VIEDVAPQTVTRLEPLYIGIPSAPLDPAWDNLFFSTLKTICQVKGIDMATAKAEVDTTGILNPGTLVISSTAPYVGELRRVIGTAPGIVNVIIEDSVNPTRKVIVQYNVTADPIPPGHIYPASAPITFDPLIDSFSGADPEAPFLPIVGLSVFVADLMGVADAASAAGIDLDEAVFASEDSSILSIDSNGIATPRRPGRVGVRIRSRDGSRSTVATVEVLPEGSGQPAGGGQPATPQPSAVTALALRPTAGAAVGGSMTLVPFVTPFDADRSGITWSSSDDSIATVSGGLVTGIRAGIVTIIVSDATGNIRAECTVTVRIDARPTTSIAISRRTLALNAGSSASLTVTYRPTNATIRGVTWISSDERIARVEPNGRVVGISAGVAIITATSDSNARIASCTVTVSIPVESVTLPETDITPRIGSTYQIAPIINPSNATNTTATYTSRSTSIATVSASGVVTARRVGTTTITVRVDGRSATLRVTVRR